MMKLIVPTASSIKFPRMESMGTACDIRLCSRIGIIEPVIHGSIPLWCRPAAGAVNM